MRKKFARYRREQGPDANYGELFAYMSKNSFLPHMQFWFDDISYLGSPRGEKPRLENMLEALQLAVFSGEELRIGNPRLFAAVFGSFNRLARGYGLDACLVDEKSFGPTQSTL